MRYSMSIPLLFSFKTFENHVMADGVILAEDALHQDWSGRDVPVVCFRLKSEGEDKPIIRRRLFPFGVIYSHVNSNIYECDVERVRACSVLAQHRTD